MVEGTPEYNTPPVFMEQFTQEDSLILTKTQEGRHFTDGEIRTQRCLVICLVHTMKKWQSWDLHPGGLAPMGTLHGIAGELRPTSI